MDMSKFKVILGMGWLMAYRIVIDCDRRRVTAYTPDDVCVMFQGDKHDSRWHRELIGWLASLTWRTRRDRSWVYLRRFVNMRTFFQTNYRDYLCIGM